MPWNRKDLDHLTVRWILLHLIQETARHTGHADIIRETIDGAHGVPADGGRRGLAGDAVAQALAPARRAPTQS